MPKTDHVREAERRQADLIRQMSPYRRLEIALSLYRTAQEIKKGALSALHPNWSDQQLESTTRRIFLTGYAGN